ncbi:hypothetical protein FYJ85_21260 [Victivallaceae bacterium BBE-744-WT-12]|uniref:Uncharacterized protein n=1 Tax=Victivallis lenta TaxID=2606640 RepID=A0A844G6M7_9BACT|nr:hypothetical protein [Victivallis lenta]MST99560.1 hypothetical protein [Victivallis lenta]
MNSPVKPKNKMFAAGKWMPKDRETLTQWLLKIMEKAEKDTGPLKPVLEDFTRDALIFMPIPSRNTRKCRGRESVAGKAFSKLAIPQKV